MDSSHRLRAPSAAGLFFVAATLFTAVPAIAADDDVLTRAHDAYYRAKERGLKDFTCDLEPNWGPLLRAQKDPKDKQAASALFGQMHMTLHAGPEVKTDVARVGAAGDSDEAEQSLQVLFDGLKPLITGFFSTYAQSMFDVPLPKPGDRFTLKRNGAGWTITYLDQNIVSAMAGDFAIQSLASSGPGPKRSIQTRFTPTKEGFLLSAYDSSYTSAEGVELEWHVAISHQRVDTFQLPKVVKLKGKNNGEPFNIEISLTHCHATKS